jgi:hypothetical protein
VRKTLVAAMLALVPVIVFAANTRCVADESASQSPVEFQTAKIFQEALRANDKDAVASLIRYPLGREYPLPPLKSPADLISNWDDFFDAADTSAMITDKPEQMGWRGVMLGNGDVWFDGDSIVAINLRTKAYFKKFNEAKNKDFLTIHPSARGYQHVAVICSTSSKSIRIQEHIDGYHYFAWAKGADLLDRPMLTLKGTMEFQGSGGGATYTFENHGYSYVLDAPEICSGGPDCNTTLTVSKAGKQLSRQICK